MKIASLGECMLELSNPTGNQLARDMACNFSYGGDTLNTAVYMARCGIDVAYISALGADVYSDWMLSEWRDEGVNTDLIARYPDAVPGLYMIQTDSQGERTFNYWRAQSAAKQFFADANALASLAQRLADSDWIYLSGITLSLMSDASFDVFKTVLDSLCSKGSGDKNAKLAFDGNYRPRNWQHRNIALQRYSDLFPLCDMVLPTFEDEVLLFDYSTVEQSIACYRDLGVDEVVLKDGGNGALIASDQFNGWVRACEVSQVIDSTGAGDSFNGAYLSARLSGVSPEQSAVAGHTLASTVICHRGAIINHDSMPANLIIKG